MTPWQIVHLAFMVINGTCCIVSAVAMDRAKAASDGWYHGDANSWRLVAAINAVAFGVNGMSLVAFP